MDDHYKWLEENLPSFFESIGLNPQYALGSISAGGDKCYGAAYKFEQAGLHFYHGVAIYLALGFDPFSDKVRNTQDGWVDPFQWIVDHKNEFTPFLPEVA